MFMSYWRYCNIVERRGGGLWVIEKAVEKLTPITFQPVVMYGQHKPNDHSSVATPRQHRRTAFLFLSLSSLSIFHLLFSCPSPSYFGCSCFFFLFANLTINYHCLGSCYVFLSSGLEQIEHKEKSWKKKVTKRKRRKRNGNYL